MKKVNTTFPRITMKITFVAIGCEQIAVSQLSAIAKHHGHQTALAFSASLFNDRYNLSFPALAPYFDDRQEVINAIKTQQPDVLTFSVLTGTYQWMLGIAAEAKSIFPNIKTIFGGVHVSAVPERVLANPCVDYVVVGEGDVCFPLILKAIEDGGPTAAIPNTRFKSKDGHVVCGPQTGFIQDLDSLPIYDKPLWEEHIRIGDLYLTMASRGCPYRCTFCFNNFFANLPEGKKGKYVRQRSIEHMLTELRWAKKRYKIRCIDFEDDVFTVNKKWIKEFLGLYKKEIALPFQCLTHPKYIDAEVATWLYEAGCRYVQLGVQTMDDDFKYTSIKRYEKSDHVQQALDVMNQAKLRVKCDHMFGLPGEPVDAQESALKLYLNHTPHRIQTFWTNFLPGTEMVGQALSMGIITPQDVEKLNDGLNFDFFRTNTNVQSKEDTRKYKAYELFFKLIPVMPHWLSQRLKVRHFMKIPIRLGNMISFLVDAGFGLINRNPAHTAYAQHNLYHLSRFFTRKLKVSISPATILRENIPHPKVFTALSSNDPSSPLNENTVIVETLAKT